MNADPFVRYLEHWTPTVGFEQAFNDWTVKQQQERREVAYVMGDIAPFRSTDGVEIGGRRQWRAHLKANDLLEFGHSDIKAQKEKWDKRKTEYNAKLRDASKLATTEHLDSEFTPAETSRIGVEVANRLHGRPTPQRKELIKLTLDVARKYR